MQTKYIEKTQRLPN